MNDLDRARRNYASAHAALRLVVETAKATDRMIAGRELPSAQAHTGAVICTTTLAHAVSLLKILPEPGLGGQLFDISSAAALTRSIAECYVAFRYHAIEPQTEEDRGFRQRLSEHHLQAKQKRLMLGMAIDDSRWTRAVAASELARAALEADPVFQSLAAPQRQHLLQARESMHRKGQVVARDAGISGDIWGSLHANLSQYAHSSPLAVARAARFDADSAVASHEMGMMARLSAMLLAKTLADMGVMIPGSDSLWSVAEREVVLVQCAALESVRPGL